MWMFFFWDQFNTVPFTKISGIFFPYDYTTRSLFSTFPDELMVSSCKEILSFPMETRQKTH